MCTDAPYPHSIDWRIGLVGFAYPEWTGPFYPSGLPERSRFPYYAARFDTVEINTTFYGPPSKATVSGWARKAPPGFRFALKAPRDVTHGPTPPGSLANAEGPEPGHFDRSETLTTLLRLFDTAAQLGSHLGPVLLQFPPAFDDRHRAELTRYLDQVAPHAAQLEGAAPHARLALEFRHDSWSTPATAAMLTERSMILAIGDHTPRADIDTDKPGRIHPPLPLLAAADTLYLRLLGRHGQFRDRTREQVDPVRRLTAWVNHIQSLTAGSPATHTVYTFFDNDYAGHAPATAERFRALAGLPPLPGGEGPGVGFMQQPSLFT